MDKSAGSTPRRAGRRAYGPSGEDRRQGVRGRRTLGASLSPAPMIISPSPTVRCGLTALALAAALPIFGCDSNEPEGSAYRIGVGDETFVVRVTDPGAIEDADSLLGSGERRIVMGDVVRGDGGFNEPYGWHLDPETVGFHDATTEVCDGLPSYVEDHLDEWIEDVGVYCPWNVEVEARLQ